MFIAGKTTIDKEFNEKETKIGNDAVTKSLRSVPNNKTASLVLFWIELHRRHIDKKFDAKELKYTYSLEHIMPQKWEEYWNQNSCPVISIERNAVITDKEKADEVRQAAVCELGNLTLLNSSLNSSLRNFEFIRKINGEKRKRGIKAYADLDITKEIVAVCEERKSWNEMVIRKRTEALTKEFFEIWN